MADAGSRSVEKCEEEPVSIGQRTKKNKGGGNKAKKVKKVKKVKKAEKKKQNRQKTIESYMDRIRTKPKEAFRSLHNSYLSTYDIYCTIDELDQCSRWLFFNVPSIHLMIYARSLGFDVLGVTSERRNKNGVYKTRERQAGEEGRVKIVYTGKANYFAKTVTSDWALKKEDIVYYGEDDSSSEPTYVEYL